MILTNQRGQVGPSFWGGFTQGIAGSLERQNERQRQKQAMDLQKKRFDLEEKEFAFKEGELKRKLLAEQRQQDALDQAFNILTGPDRTAPTVETEPGDVPVGAVPEDPRIRQRELYGALLRAQPKEMTQALMRQQTGQATTRPSVVGPGAVQVDPTGKVLFQNPNIAQRAPIDIANRTYFELRGQGMTHEDALAKATEARQTLSQGTAMGGIEAKRTPAAFEGAQNVARGGATGRRQVEAQEKLKDITSTQMIIDRAAELSSKINTATGAGRFLKGGEAALGSFLQTNPDAAELDNLRNSYSLALARSILSERGVLTNQDRSFATNTIPGVWDSKAVADRKLFQMRTLNALQREGEEALAAGKPFDVDGFRRRWRNVVQSGSQQQGQSQEGRLVPIQP